MAIERKGFGGPQEGSGRPKKEVDWKQFEDLCAIQCTASEIASVLQIHHDTLTYKVLEHYGEGFSDVYKRFSENGKMSLRRTQLKIAQKNAGMAIFLGKQYLGQKDNHDVVQITPEAATQYQALMAQLKEMQQAQSATPQNEAKP